MTVLDPDNELVITVVETDEHSGVVIAANPTIPHYGGVGTVTFCISLDAGLKIAHDTLLVWEVKGTIPTMSLELSTDTKQLKRSSIALSDDAWAHLSKMRDGHGYAGIGSGRGLFAFLAALIQHNNSPDLWRDNRASHPEQLQAFDIERLRDGKLPLWSQAPDIQIRIRKPRGIIAEQWQPLIPAYAALGRHYGISPYRGGSFENPSVVASATLEAIGLDYLTPAEWPVHSNPRTREGKQSHRNRRSQAARRAYEAFSF